MSQVEELLHCFSLSTGCLEIMELDFVGHWLLRHLEVKSLKLSQPLSWKYEEVPSFKQVPWFFSSSGKILLVDLIWHFLTPPMWLAAGALFDQISQSTPVFARKSEIVDESSHERPSSTHQHPQSLCHCLMLYFWHCHVLQWIISVQR